jgi:Predicted methyltransferase (contains TPR repeat)
MDESKHLKINEAKWDKWAETIDGKSLKYDYLRSAQSGVISLLNLHENTSMLDIGCGTGWALGEAAKLTRGKGAFYGVDLSEKMIEKAKENFKGRENFHFIKPMPRKFLLMGINLISSSAPILSIIISILTRH